MPVISNSKVTVLPAGVEIAAGNVSGLTNTGRSGQNTAVGTGYETVSRLGGTRNELYSNPLAEGTGQQVKLVSSSDDDKNQGSKAARRVLIRGLGPNGVAQDEAVAMNGTTQVTSNSYWTAVEQIIVVLVGSANDVNTGTITCYANDGTTALVQMDAGEGAGSGAFVYCPADKNMYMTQFFATAIEQAEVGVFMRRAGKGWGQRQTMFLKDNALNYKSELPIQLREGDTLEVRAKRLGSTDAKVCVDLQIATEDK